MDSYYSQSELEKLGFKKLGSNVKISKKTSIFGASHISIGSNVRIDDFTCMVANEKEIIIGSYVHIGFFCILMGTGGILIEDFSGLSSRVSIYSATDDYTGQSLTNPTIPNKFKMIYASKVILKRHSIIGTNSTVLPGVQIGTGSSIGANSLVVRSLEEWGIYFGNPVKRIKERSKALLDLETKFLSELE